MIYSSDMYMIHLVFTEYLLYTSTIWQVALVPVLMDFIF